MIRSMSWALRSLSTVVAASSLICFGAELYTVQSTGQLVWTGKDINARGDVVGGSGNSTAVHFDGRSTTGVAALGGPERWEYSTLYAINSNRLAVGQSTTGEDNTGPRRAFLFDANTGVVRELGGKASAESSANAINGAGLIVGAGDTTHGARATRFLPDGTIIDLGTLGGERSSAADVNERGEIVGSSQNADGFWRAFIIPAGGDMTDLGTLGGKESRAHAINNIGQIVGTATGTHNEWRAFLYSDGQMLDLGTLGGTTSHAFGINDEGVIVGTSTLWTGLPAAFVRYPGEPMRDLNNMVKLYGEDFLESATAINNNGYIVASQFHPIYRTGVAYTVVLKPGVISGIAREREWQLTIGAPPGRDVRLEQSDNLLQWTFMRSITGGSEVSLAEPLEWEPRFYRIVRPN